MKKYTIWSLVDESQNTPFSHEDCPMGLNFSTGLTQRLHPDRTFVKGEITTTIYYKDATIDPLDPNSFVFTTPVVQESFVYTRDSLGFATARTQTIRWYFDDNTLDTVNYKTRMKLYTKVEAVKEGKRRRGNVIDDLLLTVTGMMLATIQGSTDEAILQMGRDFTATHKTVIQNYVDENNLQIITDLNSDTSSWIDNVIDANGTTIKLYINSVLS